MKIGFEVEATRTVTYEADREDLIDILQDVDGDTKEGTFMAGQISGMIKEIKPVKTIIEEMFADANKLLGESLKV